ncbi:Myb-like_DNA-binding domain-containing protein [Hexamita inflata]|uniref:Myb-like DNA-binding domain-containing protein n=1 Tax=Hexamita inflata TaxID=28002 RepID=A0AA86UBQ5_9EUKA|nr:Myb-like DNA-binding domain-containing protein [Hexamita inflata]
MQNFDVSESRPNIYQNWSEAEIDRLIDVVERSQNYETGKINWTSVQLLFPERTLQQCKSFYCNQIKPYIFRHGEDLSKENIKFTLTCYYYYITEKFPGDYEPLEVRVQRVLADQCWKDMIQAYENSFSSVNLSETQLSCNIKLMKGTRYMINFHNQNKDLIEQQLKTKAKIVKMGFEITKQNWKQFLKKFEKNKLEDILKKVEQQLRALKM